MVIEMDKINIGFFIAIIFILLCICFIIYLSKNNKNEDIAYNGDNNNNIINACKKYVYEYLKCPSTAKFYKINILSQDKYGRVFVDLSVDSQNGFGAMIRTNFGVVLYPDNNEYKTTDCGVCKYSFYKTEEKKKKINNWNKPI